MDHAKGIRSNRDRVRDFCGNLGWNIRHYWTIFSNRAKQDYSSVKKSSNNKQKILNKIKLFRLPSTVHSRAMLQVGLGVGLAFLGGSSLLNKGRVSFLEETAPSLSILLPALRGAGYTLVSEPERIHRLRSWMPVSSGAKGDFWTLGQGCIGIVPVETIKQLKISVLQASISSGFLFFCKNVHVSGLVSEAWVLKGKGWKPYLEWFDLGTAQIEPEKPHFFNSGPAQDRGKKQSKRPNWRHPGELIY